MGFVQVENLFPQPACHVMLFPCLYLVVILASYSVSLVPGLYLCAVPLVLCISSFPNLFCVVI